MSTRKRTKNGKYDRNAELFEWWFADPSRTYTAVAAKAGVSYQRGQSIINQEARRRKLPTHHHLRDLRLREHTSRATVPERV